MHKTYAVLDEVEDLAEEGLDLVHEKEFHDIIVETLSRIGGQACLGTLVSEFPGLSLAEMKSVLQQMVRRKVLQTFAPNLPTNASEADVDIFTTYELNL